MLHANGVRESARFLAAESKPLQVQMRSVIVAFAVACATAAGIVLEGLRLYHAPGPSPATQDILVPRGGLDAVASTLVKAGVVRYGLTLRLSAIATFADGPVHTAELSFPAAASIATVLHVLRHGKPVQHRLTIAEGLQAAQIAQLMSRQGALLRGELAVPEEGAMLPETYAFDRGTGFAVLIGRAEAAMSRAVAAEWVGRAAGLPLRSADQALILASIVEHEARLPAERPMIARVFLNRLNVGMRLQADPTTAYGVGGGLASLIKPLDHDDLERIGPYNTYLFSGLPGGPICSPGLASLHATLHPASGNALYFVADGTGGHVFAASLSQHVANVTRYRARLQERRMP